MDLSHPVHADNCVLDPDTGECWREPPAYTYRDYRWAALQGLGGVPGWGLTACLLSSSLSSGLLYLNDDFQGGDLFFTEPNALTVTVTDGKRGRAGRGAGSPAIGWGFKTEGAQRQMLGNGRGHLCCCLVAKLCPTLCDAMDCSRPGFPVLHYLPEFA